MKTRMFGAANWSRFFRVAICIAGLSIAELAVVGVFASAANAAGSPKNFNLQYKHVSNQLIVKFRTPHKSDAAAALIRSQGGTTSYVFASTGAQLISFSGKAGSINLAKIAKAVAANPNVEYVEANTILRAYDKTPNDTDFSKLYGMTKISAPAAWSTSVGTRDVVVGVIDTGIDYTHPDIAPNYWTNPGESGLDASGKDKKTNGKDDDGNGFVDDWRGWNFVKNSNDPMDDYKHGTHCAGTIGAAGNNGQGVAGVNWNVSLVALKFLDGSGSGTLDNAVKAIEYAKKIKITMTSNSWGGGGFSQTMSDAIKALQKVDQLFIAAAGNESSNTDVGPSYPAGYVLDNVISVAATDSDDVLADFSNYGAKTVDLAAPGVEVWSTVLNKKYEFLSGTSMATPHVAGAAALVKSVFPKATYKEVRDRLFYGVEQVAALKTKTVTGGRLNVANAIEVDPVTPGLVHDIKVAGAGRDFFKLSFQAAGDDGDVGRASRYEIRIAGSSIDTEAEWSGAEVATSNVVLTASEAVNATITGLPLNAKGFFAIRAFDNVGNAGGISDSFAYATAPVRVLTQNDASSMNGITATGTWGLEDLGNGQSVFSDSPGVAYKNNIDSTMTLTKIVAPSSTVLLALTHKYSLESGYDFAYVEVSIDGGKAWKKAATYTGRADIFVTDTIDLTEALAGKQEFLLRFHFHSDYDATDEGWQIDSVAVLVQSRK